MLFIAVAGAVVLVILVCAACLVASNKSDPESSARRLLSPTAVSLAIDRHHPGVVVTDVKLVKIHRCGDGYASTTDRVHLELTFGAGSPKDHQVPKLVLAKIILLSPVFRAGASLDVVQFIGRFTAILESLPVLSVLANLLCTILGLYQQYFPHAPDSMYRNEAQFYRDIRPTLGQEIETCQVYGTIVSEADKVFGVIMEDLSLRKVCFPNALTSHSVEQVGSLLSTHAALHATFWGSPPPWLPGHRQGGMHDVFSAIGRMLIEDQVKRHAFKQRLLQPLGKSVRALFAAVDVAQAFLEEDTPTMCHGDSHIANTYLDSLDGKGGFLDWQLTIRGSYAHDITYLICTSLSPEDRRLHQEGLLRKYLEDLRRHLSARGLGEQTPTFDHTWLRYRQAPIWGLVIGWLITPPVNYGEQITSANIGRMVQACIDLKTLNALGVE